MKRFRDSELIVGVVVAIIAITTFANVTLITSSVTSVYIGWLSGVLSMNAALMITRANARIKAKREIEAQRASDKQVQAETYAAQRWQAKMDDELQSIVDSKRICKCGHAKSEHKINPIVDVAGIGVVMMMGQRPDACMHGYIDGVSNGCDCPAFLLEDSKENH